MHILISESYITINILRNDYVDQNTITHTLANTYNNNTKGVGT